LLDRITGIIADHGEDRHLKDEALKYACDVSDSLSWALGDIDTESFTGPDYFNLDRLVAIVMEIERKRGRQARLLLMRLVAYVRVSRGREARKSRAYDIHACSIYMRQTAGLGIPSACPERMGASQNRNCMLSATLYVWPLTVKKR